MAFKQKMIERLTGKDAVSANQLAEETGIVSAQRRYARHRPEKSLLYG